MPSPSEQGRAHMECPRCGQGLIFVEYTLQPDVQQVTVWFEMSCRVCSLWHSDMTRDQSSIVMDEVFRQHSA